MRPLASIAELRQFFVGKDISDVPKPAVVLDVNVVQRNCAAMLRTMKALKVGFRAHVKSHKVPQIARLQVGEGDDEVKFVTSTVLEIEILLPLLKEYKSDGRRVNVLYGVPLVPSQVLRLAAIASELGEDSISVMIDHPDQLPCLQEFYNTTGFPACIFVKVDAGYHRAGLPPAMLNKGGLLQKLAEAEESGVARLLGLYSHSSLSYSGNSPNEAMAHLSREITACRDALLNNMEFLHPGRKITISVGATPQVVSSQDLLNPTSSSQQARSLKALLANPCGANSKYDIHLELHAGVYPILDMQQVATRARSGMNGAETEIAISVVAEVASTYTAAERGQPEALVAVGTLGLGREPCQGDLGWGLVGSWRRETAPAQLIVNRISQEHSIISWAAYDESRDADIPVRVGQTVRIYPNHACVTGAMYGWYLVVDSEVDSESAKIVEVWVRPSGW
ncbi:hypothetical protein M436DRAFT_41823 [Aureobasidium namibiae CBS 147.97]|uniref:D-serine dehydratase n=1 Tax=Aureobasidium namibiae CBS 147.97 TaxID=1043004 RepID=A0A074WUI7_9PEZI|nr:uncharacterized protein M436DRAFT_41823 [Aureobasidium namibiae CBS 147.97]KEQ75184.1 hypothetical protein M436DRAFT_41823 [Aureobasidium namibiae CBS 147.97]